MVGKTDNRGGFDGPWPAAVALAARQHWAISTAQLRDVGLTERQIAPRVRTSALHRHHRGVYALGRPVLTFAGHCVAALLACGPGAAISHRSAARLWALMTSAGMIHVSAPRSRAGHEGLRMHWPRSLPAEDLVVREGIAVTSLGRTLLDLAATTSVERLGGLIHEAGVQRALDAREIRRVLERHPQSRGHARLEAALALEVAPTRSGLERAYLVICEDHRLPRPRVNEHVSTERGLEEVDFHWPHARLVVEVDGGRYHSSAWRRRRDAEKTARLVRSGLTVRRFTELEIALAPRAVAEETAALHAASPFQPRA